MRKPFQSAFLMPSRISFPIAGVIGTFFSIHQLWIGEDFITTVMFLITWMVFILAFNITGGLRTIPGIMLGLYGFSSFVAYALLCAMENLPIRSHLDDNQELLTLNLLAMICLTAAAFIYRNLSFSDGIFARPMEQLRIARDLPTGIPALIALLGGVFAVYANLIPFGLGGFLQMSLPALCLVAWRMIDAGQSKRIAYIALIAAVLLAWKANGLSGMKSSLVMPLATSIAAASLIKARLPWLVLIPVALIFMAVNIIAFAIQPLRNLPPEVGAEKRTAIAIAYLALDLELRYSIKWHINQPEVEELIEQLRSQARREEKRPKIGMFSRLSLVEDDGKMLNSVYQRGFLDFEKYFEEVLFVPRAISGETFRTDKVSAFYGRYAGSIGRFNTTTGVAFSSGVLSYAHGGYPFLVINLFCGALLIFALCGLVFGSFAAQNDFGRIFMLSLLTSTSSTIELTTFWQILTRGLPLTIFSYLILYFLTSLATSLLTLRSDRILLGHPKQLSRY